MLTDRHIFAGAVVLYGLGAVYSIFLWRKGFRRDDWVNYLILVAAAMLHTVTLVKRGLSFSRCPVGNLFEVITFMAWALSIACVAAGVSAKLRFIGAFACPVLMGMGVFALMPGMDPPVQAKDAFATNWGSVHAGLILLSCGAFGLGSVAGVMYLTQDHDLKFRKVRAIHSLLPPMQRLDRVTTGLLLTGFILLTAGLSLSPLLMQQKYGVAFRQDPMVLYAAFVWVVYMVLLGIRWKFGFGGRRFAWGATGTFAFVLLTFWGFILLSPAHAP